eukprot:TRINITY_DN37697_c0_g1_i1.p1 TRINITY_DN37697_c0_g1~~TRINITY_DN37697_c0_g1_i1.p1  ORF type:complete len:338 (+),score=69.83 TRINITY_DN37697_c0_g1_i1:181-1194(+)
MGSIQAGRRSQSTLRASSSCYVPSSGPLPSVPTYSIRNGSIRKLRTDKVLVVTDLDHTLVGHEKDPENALLESFKSVWLGEFTLNGSCLCYSTGRNKFDALHVAEERQLPRPELMICAVGTEIYEVPRDLPLMGWWEAADRITLVPEWQKAMLRFDREAALKVLEKFPKFDVRGSVETDPYRIPTAYEVDADWLTAKEELIAALGSECQVISSGGHEWKLVDVLSAEGGKRKALEFAINRLKFDPANAIACGDSGNDETMFHSQGAKAVMVANALPELVAALSEAYRASLNGDGTPTTELQKGHSFKTVDGCTVLFASREVAAGIVEALDTWFPARH